jgi:hypothetical protein
MDTKRCGKCKKIKDESEYYVRGSGYLQSYCIECCKQGNNITPLNSEILEYIRLELDSAKKKYTDFPQDIIHCVSIMNEEAGESIRAALNHVYHGESINKLKEELIQTAAMCIRCLERIK